MERVKADDVQLRQIEVRLEHDQDEKSEFVDLRGRPVDKSKTGRWRGAALIYVFFAGEFTAGSLVMATLLQYLTVVMHQPISNAATITTNFIGTGYIITILGGFVADSYLGCFWTIIGGAFALCMGLGVLTFSTSYSRLQPALCVPGRNTTCKPAGARYMIPLYLALYAIALGMGFIRPNLLAIGANQFDGSAVEKKQSVHFFIWYYFASMVGYGLALCPGVYLENYVSRSWGFGFGLLLTGFGTLIFILGGVAGKLRHRSPSGSFLTRTAQVFISAVRKRNVDIPAADSGAHKLFDPPHPENFIHKLNHTNEMRFLNRAAVIDGSDMVPSDALVSGRKSPNPWRLCTVTQVEETKRILQMIPIWIFILPVHLLYGQFLTFSIQQGQTLDRKLGPHFEIPAASLNIIGVIGMMLVIPVYDMFLIPFLRRFTKIPSGFTPLQRMGSSIVLGGLAMTTAALVERKRLTYVHKLHLESLTLGGYVLPMKVWWVIPQLFLGALLEVFAIVPSFELFYHEASMETRSISSSFTYSALAVGSFLSTAIVKAVNRITRNMQGGSWLEEEVNHGGLEKFFWLLTVVLAVDLPLFLVCSHRYRYKYDWYH